MDDEDGTDTTRRDDSKAADRDAREDDDAAAMAASTARARTAPAARPLRREPPATRTNGHDESAAIAESATTARLPEARPPPHKAQTAGPVALRATAPRSTIVPPFGKGSAAAAIARGDPLWRRDMAPPREAASIDEGMAPRAELPREDIWGTALMVPLRDDQMEPEQATPDDTKRRGIKRTPAATLMLDAFNNEQWYGCTIITIKPKWPSIRLSNGKPGCVAWEKLRLLRDTTER